MKGEQAPSSSPFILDKSELTMGEVGEMNKEVWVESLTYKVECTWCGTIIRRNSAKDSRGMCLKCYARMLSDHARSYENGTAPRWASDR